MPLPPALEKLLALVPKAKAGATSTETAPKKDLVGSKSESQLTALLKQLGVVDIITVDAIADEAAELAARTKLIRKLTIQALAIAVLALATLFLMPFFEDRYFYYTITAEQKVSEEMRPLNMPLWRDETIKTWAATSVTEILTLGFGDFEQKLVMQKSRFTSDGWNDFLHKFFEVKFGDTLRHNQLVITTVPEKTPEIVDQHTDPDHVYEWVVRVPVLMTYATNNLVTRTVHTSVTVTIIRTPYDGTASNGIGIDVWQQ